MQKRVNGLFRVAVILSILIGLSGDVAAESDYSKDHNWALSFLITEEFNLSPLEGQGVAIRKILSDVSGIRVSEYIGYSGFDGDGGEERTYFENELSVLYYRYTNPGQRARLYWGLGPYLYYEYRKNIRITSHTYEAIRKQWSAGALGVLGAEYFLNGDISFHAEYRLSASYNRDIETRKDTDPDYSDRSKTYDSFSVVGGSGVVFGISVHF